MTTPRLVDEFDPQEHACAITGLVIDDNDETEVPEWGADPFNILAQLEDELGYPIHSS